MTARRAAAALVLAWLAAAGPVRANELTEAKARFRKGADLYRQKRWAEAMAEFEAAYRLKPHGAIHFNIARCREALEDWPGALRSYHDYLREVPAATDRAAVRAAMARIEARIASAGTQVLLVYTDPPGASVSLDGADRGTTPLHAVLPVGAHALVVSREGYAPLEERVELSASASRVVDVVLRPAAGAPAQATAPDLAPRPAEVVPEPVPLAPPSPPASVVPARRRYLATWIAAGTAVAAAGVGAWFGWSARQDERAIDFAPDPATASARVHGAQTKARTANVLFAVAGGAAAFGGGLFVLEARF